MSPPAKRQRNDSGGSGALHDDGTGQNCSGAGQAKAASKKKQRRDSAAGTVLKAEWSGLSKRAQSRHNKNEIMARIRAMIPGPGKVSENGLMLQAAARIKELEIEIESLSNYLERLQKSQSSEGNTDNNSTDQGVAAVIPAIQQTTDGSEAIRAVLPQATKANGKRLLECAWEYMTELEQEINQLKHQIDELLACTKPKTPPDREK